MSERIKHCSIEGHQAHSVAFAQLEHEVCKSQEGIVGHLSLDVAQFGHGLPSDGPNIDPSEHVKVLRQYPQPSMAKQPSQFETSRQ